MMASGGAWTEFEHGTCSFNDTKGAAAPSQELEFEGGVISARELCDLTCKGFGRPLHLKIEMPNRTPQSDE